MNTGETYICSGDETFYSAVESLDRTRNEEGEEEIKDQEEEDGNVKEEEERQQVGLGFRGVYISLV